MATRQSPVKVKKKKSRMKSLPGSIDTVDGTEVPREREKEKKKRSVATRSFRSAKEFIYSAGGDKNTAKDELELSPRGQSAFVIRSPRDSARSPRTRKQGPLNRPKIGHKKTPYDTYSRIALNLFNAMGIDEETQAILYKTMKKTSGMKKLKEQNVCSVSATVALENIEIDIRLLKSDQKKQKSALLIQSAFRSFKAQREYRTSLEQFQSTKINSFHELCEKEKDFVMSLATLVSQYIVPLRVSQDKHLKKVSSDMEDVFSSVEKILAVHQTLLKTLYELPRESWPHLNGLGNVFTYISPHWKIYGTYVHNFKFALHTMEDTLDNNEHFKEFLERKQQLSSDLTMLLSLPLNHIAGYSGHLKNILDTTPEDSPEHYSLLQAISITTETSNFIGNSLAHAENLATIHRLRMQTNSTAESEALFVELEENNSKFIMEANVDFVLSGSKKTHQGCLSVFDSICFVSSSGHKGRTVKHIYHLETVTIEKTVANGFALFVVDEEKPSYDCIVENSRVHFSMEPADKVDFTIQNIQNLIAHNQRNRTFGVPIETLIERDKQEDGIPVVLKDMITFIEREGMDTVGLFRIPGTATAIKKAKTIYNQCNGNYPTLAELGFMQANDVAGLLKMFFHDLPEPLIPHTLYSQFINIFPTESKNLVVVLQEVKEVLDQIPTPKKRVLKYVLGFLVRVAKVEENKMGPSNLSTCFGTNILRPLEQTIESTLAMPKSNSCVECLIQYFDILFEDTVVQLRSRPKARK